MKKMEQKLSKVIFLFLSLISLFCTVTSCNSWMEDDGFFEDIEGEVKYANAPEISVFVRYASTEMGNTTPEGFVQFKKDIEAEISATTNDSYGFYRWAAFSTSFLDSGVQHSDFVFVNDENFEETMAPYELPDSVVYFEDRTSPKTKIKILEQRSDIYIIPIVAVRPSITLSIPGNGASSVIRNMTIRVNFSKPMDIDSFFDENGICDKITITQGTQSFNNDGSIEVSTEDITNRFAEPSLSTNGQMLTLRFKPKEDGTQDGFTPQSYVNIKISDEVKDTYGYTMGTVGKDKSYTLSFQAGTNFDTLAPRISELSGGIDSDFTKFKGLYKDTGTASTLGSFTTFTLTQGAPTSLNQDINNEYYSDVLMSQRIKDKVNIRVLVEDISGAGSGQSQMGAESDVSTILVRASRVFDKDGNPVSATEENVIGQRNIQYVALKNDSEISGTYMALINAANSLYHTNLNNSKGYLFTYDLSTLGDGLIRIDIAAVDTVGNNGFGEGGQYSSEYGNGYATLFVVKDSTPPDAAQNSLENAITSVSALSPYSWYNSSTYNTINIINNVNNGNNGIHDKGHAKLRSKVENIKWIIKTTSETTWVDDVASTSTEWAPVLANYSIGNNFVSPTADGPITLTYALIDDLGNKSTVSTISSIVYDNTSPVIGSGVDWVDVNGAPILNSTAGTVTGDDVYLKIPFTEVTSGVRRISVSVNGIQNAFENSVYYYNIAETPNGSTITINTEDTSLSETVKPFVVANPVGNIGYLSGNIFIKNIKIGESDGLYPVTVSLIDSALNTSTSVTANFSRDNTSPVVSNLTVTGIVRDRDTQRAWVRNQTGNTVTFNVTEKGSGINQVALVSGAVLTDSSRILYNGTDITETINVAANTFTFANHRSPVLCGENMALQITNVTLTSADSANGSITIRTTDFVGKNGTADFAVNWDSTPTPILDEIYISDASSTSQVYTNTTSVKLNLTVPTDSGAGIVKLVIDGASFANGTNTMDISQDPTIAGAKEYTITLVPGEGNKSINIKTIDLLGNESITVASNQIMLDTVKPVINGLEWITDYADTVPGAVRSNILDDQTLYITFTEVTSAVKKLTLNIFKDSGTTPYATPFAANTLSITDVNNSPIDFTIDTTDSKTIIFTTPLLSNTIKIKNLKIADSNSASIAQGTYSVKVQLEDSALNIDQDDGNKYITLDNDSTYPIVKEVRVDGLVKVLPFDDNTATPKYFLKNENRTSNITEKSFTTPLLLKLEENTSGVRKIVLTGATISKSDNFALSLIGSSVVPVDSTKYTVTTDTTAQTITIYFTNSNDSLNKGKPESEKEFTLKIDGLTFTGYEHNISVKIYDVAKNDSADNNTIKSGTNANPLSTTNFSVDYSGITETCVGDIYILKDNNPSPYPAELGYTNSEYVDSLVMLNLEPDTESTDRSSGVNKITITGAVVDNTSILKYSLDNSTYTTIPTTAYQVTSGNEITFNANTAITKTGYLQIINLKLTGSDGLRTVTYTYSHVTGLSDHVKSHQITLDKTVPEWDGQDSLYTPYISGVTNDILTLYPAAKQGGLHNFGYKVSAATNGDGKNVLYFYTNMNDPDVDGSIAHYIAGNAIDSNLKDKYLYLSQNIVNTSVSTYKAETNTSSFSDTGTTILSNDTINNGYATTNYVKLSPQGATSSYALISVDKAGNYSKSINFYVVQDNSVTEDPQSTFDGYFTMESPSGVKAYKKNVEHDGKKKIILARTNNPFKIVFHLGDNGVPAGKETFNYNQTSTGNTTALITKGTETRSPIVEYGIKYNDNSSDIDYFKYQKQSGPDYSKNTDTKNGIQSYVDENGNIIIDILETYRENYTILIYLRDGCGNEKPVQISNDSGTTTYLWETDTKLGSVEVDADGRAQSRTFKMYPGAEVVDSGNDIQWDSVKYKYNNTSITSTGVNALGRIVKNTSTRTSYYNNNAKLGGIVSAHETVSVGDNYIRTTDTSEYTVRIKLCCVPANAPEPDKTYIENITSTNGQATDWLYVVAPVADTSKARFFIDYPHPNYSALGWTKSEPYCIYYYIEDFVGNYEINKVVNSQSETDMIYWLYDNTSPEITVGNSTKTPNDDYYISNSNINELVPNNNGYRANYFPASVTGETGRVDVWWNKNDDNLTGSNLPHIDGIPYVSESECRTGTTRTIPSVSHRVYNPFFDIKISEESGIRAYAYTTDENPPNNDTWCNSVTDGYLPIHAEGHWYGGSTSADGSTVLDDSYSGTKVCTVLPYDFLISKDSNGYNFPKEGTPSPIYLHVMDWVGNIQTYRMGGNVNWYVDVNEPAIVEKTESFEKYSVITDTSSVHIEFAGNLVQTEMNADQNSDDAKVKVYLPGSSFKDDNDNSTISGTFLPGSVYGWSVTNNDVGTVKTDSNGSYIELKPKDYIEKTENDPTETMIYIYDSVGNVTSFTCKIYMDNTPPEYKLYVRSNAATGTATKDLFITNQGFNPNSDATHGTNHLLTDDNSENTTLYPELYTDLETIKAKSKFVYTKDNCIDFISYCDAEKDKINETNSNNVKFRIYKWNTSDLEWNTLYYYESSENKLEGETSFFLETYYCTSPRARVDGVNAGYFCFEMKDRAGNPNYVYVYAEQDNTGPVVSDVTLDKVNLVNGTYYFGHNSKITYKVTDASSGILYDGHSGPNGTDNYAANDRQTEVTIDYTMANGFVINGTANYLTIKVKDNLQNETTFDIRTVYPGTWTNTPTSYPTVGEFNLNTDTSVRNVQGKNDYQKYIGFNDNEIVLNKIKSFDLDVNHLFSSTTLVNGFVIVVNDSTPPELSSWNGLPKDNSFDRTKTGVTNYSISCTQNNNNYYTINCEGIDMSNYTFYLYPLSYNLDIGEVKIIKFTNPQKPVINPDQSTWNFNSNFYDNGTTKYIADGTTVKIPIKASGTDENDKISSYILYYEDADGTQHVIQDGFNQYRRDFGSPVDSIDFVEQEFSLKLYEEEYPAEGATLKIEVNTVDCRASSEPITLGYFVQDTSRPSMVVDSSSVVGENNNGDTGFATYELVSSTPADKKTIRYGINATKIIITPTGEDNLSGVQGYQKYNSLDETIYPTQLVYNVSELTDGVGFGICVYDNVQNRGLYTYYAAYDDSTSVINNVSVTGENTSIDADNVIWYNNAQTGASIKLSCDTTSTTPSYYYYLNAENEKVTSTDGTFTLFEGNYNFYAVTDVGNESAAYPVTVKADTGIPPLTGTLKFYKDDVEVTYGYSIDSDNNVTFNPYIINKCVFDAPSYADNNGSTGTGSGIKGYADSATSTTWNATIPSLTLDMTALNVEYNIFAKDNANNITEGISYKLTASAVFGPTVTNTIVANPPYGSYKSDELSDNKLKCQISAIELSSGTVPITIIKDSIVGNGYTTLMYTYGDDAKFDVTLSDGHDCVGYAFTAGNSNAVMSVLPEFTATDSTNLTGNTLTVKLPEITVPHYYLFLWLKDSAGKLSVYNIIQHENGDNNWWIAAPGSVSPSYKSELLNYNNKTLEITGLGTAPITKIVIEGNNLQVNNYNNKLKFTFDWTGVTDNFINKTSYDVDFTITENSGNRVTLTCDGYFSGTGKIKLKNENNNYIGNNGTTVSSVTVYTSNDTTGISCPVTNTSNSSSQNFFGTVYEVVRSVFTPNAKKVDLKNTKVVEKDSKVKEVSEVAQNIQSTDVSVNNKKAKVRKATPDKVKLNSTVAKNAVTQKKNTVIPEGAKVLEVTAIENMTNLSVASTEIIETSGVETTVVKNDSEVSNKDNFGFVYGIIAIVMCAVIAMVVIVNKVLVDKTK